MKAWLLEVLDDEGNWTRIGPEFPHRNAAERWAPRFLPAEALQDKLATRVREVEATTHVPSKLLHEA